MNEWLQWAAIIALFLFVCFARESAVEAAHRELAEYDEQTARAIRGEGEYE